MIARELLKGTLKYLVINLLLRNKRMYGYEITQVLDEESGGRIKLTFAALYPVLHKLEAEGILKTESVNVSNRIRKYYTLTPKGTKHSEVHMNDMRDYLALMQKLTSK